MLKGNARKVRRLYNDKVIAGFAGGTADAFTLFERFESKLQAHNGNLTRAAVELAKDWRTDRMLRRLEALLIVADATASLLITGNGDVVEQEHDLIAIGSGGAFAQSAARMLVQLLVGCVVAVSVFLNSKINLDRDEPVSLFRGEMRPKPETISLVVRTESDIGIPEVISRKISRHLSQLKRIGNIAGMGFKEEGLRQKSGQTGVTGVFQNQGRMAETLASPYLRTPRQPVVVGFDQYIPPTEFANLLHLLPDNHRLLRPAA